MGVFVDNKRRIPCHRMRQEAGVTVFMTVVLTLEFMWGICKQESIMYEKCVQIICFLNLLPNITGVSFNKWRHLR